MIAFDVQDMSCDHCVRAITEAVKAIDGEARVEIDLATHRVVIEHGLADAGAYGAAIREAGYTPVPVPE